MFVLSEAGFWHAACYTCGWLRSRRVGEPKAAGAAREGRSGRAIAAPVRIRREPGWISLRRGSIAMLASEAFMTFAGAQSRLLPHRGCLAPANRKRPGPPKIGPPILSSS